MLVNLESCVPGCGTDVLHSQPGLVNPWETALYHLGGCPDGLLKIMWALTQPKTLLKGKLPGHKKLPQVMSP